MARGRSIGGYAIPGIVVFFFWLVVVILAIILLAAVVHWQAAGHWTCGSDISFLMSASPDH